MKIILDNIEEAHKLLTQALKDKNLSQEGKNYCIEHAKLIIEKTYKFLNQKEE
jgi:hypothetical protein